MKLSFSRNHPAELGNEEHHDREEEQEYGDPHQVLHGVYGWNGMPSRGVPSGPLVRLISTPSGLFEPTSCSARMCSTTTARRGERKRHHVEGEEAVQGGVGDHVVAADPQGQRLADSERDGAEQRNDHLRAPVGHLPPGKQVPHERLRHEDDVDEHAEQPDELAVSLVGAVDERPEHVQVHGDEEERGSGRMHVANEPSPLDVAHDGLDGVERFGRGRLVVHREPDPAHDLDDEDDERDRAEVVPEVEVLRSVVAREVLFPQADEGEPRVDPLQQAIHESASSTPWSTPISIRSPSR